MSNSPELQASLFKKMAGVMGRIERLPKRGTNPHFGYPYVLDADVLQVVRTAMAAEGLAFFVDMGEVTQGEPLPARGRGAPNHKTLIPFTITFADSETGATRTSRWVGESLDSQDKGIAKAATAAIKYALCKTFLISTGDPMDDPDQGHNANINGNGAEEITTTPRHWIDKETPDGKPISDLFAAFIKDNGLSKKESLDALKVTNFHAYTGTLPEAKAAIIAAADEKWDASKWWPVTLLDDIVEAKYAENVHNAKGMLNLSKVLKRTTEPDVVIGWCQQYRAKRNANVSSGIAAEEADMWLLDEGAEEKAPSPGTPVEGEIPYQ